MRPVVIGLSAAFCASASASATASVKVRLESTCDAEMYVYLRYRNKKDEWRNAGWYTMEPYESFYINSDGPVLSNNLIFYVYADTKDGRGFFSRTRENDDHILKMRNSKAYLPALRLVGQPYDDYINVSVGCE
ncbi:hypothetical protein SAMN04487991_1502 [Celeribacter neptunius]|uniref:DUF1036 domain-containing protein n=2 Tax=Celeribacter neptunius TaxID=588602 RepID=A0A1I3NYY7_9RHOB|nr:hypothetical protein SAMN04487991_1502 [Celeribacter neptunius]